MAQDSSEDLRYGDAMTKAGAHATMAPENDGRALRYRPEIDGLRALAILPILLLHSGVTGLRGGFVGVDIFFVISGYLITTIMVRDIAAGRFSLLRFYRHRIVRILPALLVMMIVVLAIGCVLLLPVQLRDLGRSMAATSGFVSNVYFYRTIDYFTVAADAKPLIHTWSLAVEEQFYLLYPLLLWGLRQWPRRRLVWAIGSLGLASLAAGCWMALNDPAAGFFLLPARIWELSVGALVALGAVPTVASARWRRVLCAAAIATIAASCIVIRDSWPFPLPFALPPVVAAAILIAYGGDGSTVRVLGAWPLRWIGLISYPAYLWHRPIIAFYQSRHTATVTPAETGLLLLATLGMAWASYALVERPVAKRWRGGTGIVPHVAAALALVGIAAAGLAVAANAERIRPLPPRLALAASYIGWDTTPAGRRQFSVDRCFLLPTGQPFDPGCLTLSTTRPNIALIGDSHAAHFSQALRELRPDVRIVQATAAGCRPLLQGRGRPGCLEVMRRAFATLDFRRIDTVILSGRWFVEDRAGLIEAIRFLRARGTRVLVIGPSVEYDADLPVLIVRAAREDDPTLPGRTRIAERFALDRTMAVAVRSAGADYGSAITPECVGNRCRTTTADGTPLHFDHSHFTPPGARAVLSAILTRQESRRNL